MGWRKGFLYCLFTSLSIAAHAAEVRAPAPPPVWIVHRDGAIDASQISRNEAVWVAIRTVTAAEAKVPGTARQLFEKVVGLDGKSATTLLAHMKAAVSEEQSFSASQDRTSCAGLRDAWVGKSVMALAAKFEEHEAAIAAHQQAYGAQLSQSLDAEGLKKFDAWVEVIRSKMKIDSVDYSRFLSDPAVDPAAVIARVCPQSN